MASSEPMKTERIVYNSVHQAPALGSSVPFTREDMQNSLEQFCQTKNLPLAKFKNILRTNSAPPTPNTNSPTFPSSPSLKANSISLSNSTSSVASYDNISSDSPVPSPKGKPDSSAHLGLTPALNNLRFSLSANNGSESLSGSSLIAKRGSDDDYDGHPSKRMKKNSLNVKLRVHLSFDDSLHGCTKKVEYQCYTSCPQCCGSEAQLRKSCPVCNGMGRLLRQKTVEIESPPDVKQHSKKIYKDQGHVSEDLDVHGDLLVEFDIDDHPFYKRNGENAFCRVTISIVQAVLGAKITIPKIYGDQKERIEVAVPPGTQPNDMVRVPSEGFKKANCKKKRGDIEVSIAVEIPRKLMTEQKELYEKLFLLESMLHLSGLGQ